MSNRLKFIFQKILFQILAISIFSIPLIFWTNDFNVMFYVLLYSIYLKRKDLNNFDKNLRKDKLLHKQGLLLSIILFLISTSIFVNFKEDYSLNYYLVVVFFQLMYIFLVFILIWIFPFYFSSAEGKSEFVKILGMEFPEK